MSTYVQVKDGQVQEDTIGPLPETGFAPDANGTLVGVSGFDKLSPSLLKQVGWLRYIDGGEPAHDPATHEAVPAGYRVTFDWVERTYEIRPRDPYLDAVPDTIPADDETTATVNYVDARPEAPAEVTFSINGATQTVELGNGRASLAVSTAHPGRVEVSVDALPGRIASFTATEV